MYVCMTGSKEPLLYLSLCHFQTLNPCFLIHGVEIMCLSFTRQPTSTHSERRMADPVGINGGITDPMQESAFWRSSVSIIGEVSK